MKKINLVYFLAIFFMGFMTSCGEDTPDPEPMTNTIVDIATGDDNFSSLVAALTKAGLVETLNQTGAFTVFAPTNDAFDQLFVDLGVSGLDDLSAAQLTPILLYHVLAGEVKSSAITEGYVTSLSTSGPGGVGVDILLTTSGGVTLNGDSKVTTADVDADNGVVHIIDKVILPPSVVDIAIDNSSFTSLVDAVIQAGLVDALSATGPFTVFAPTNDAFSQLLTDLGITSLSEVDNAMLTEILLYHVVSGNVTSTDLSDGDVATLAMDRSLTVSTDGGVTLNGDVNVVSTDIQGTNGIVHVIDKVLVPMDPSNTIVDIAAGNEAFSILVEAVTRAGLVETLSGEGSFTVFAPTNDAFNSLFSELGITGLDDLTDDQISDIVLYHALGTENFSGDLSTTYVSTLNTSAPGDNAISLYIEVGEGVVLNGNTTVTTADVDADNGVVHIIDNVLLPTDVVDAAIDNSMFSSLVSAVTMADLVETLKTDGPFTVFAPTDDAFAQLLVDLGVSTISEIDMNTLTNVLLYHVVSGNVRSTDLSSGEVPSLLDNNSLSIQVGDKVLINNDVEVIATDVQTKNGVIHVINKVLLPAN